VRLVPDRTPRSYPRVDGLGTRRDDRRVIRLVVAGLGVLLLLGARLALAAPAAAPVLAPQVIAVGDVEDPVVAVADGGIAVVGWSSVVGTVTHPQFRAMGSTLVAGRWTAPRVLSRSGFHTSVAIAAGDRQIAVWQQTSAPYSPMLAFGRQGRWGRALRLAVSAGAYPAVGVAANGTGLVAWTRPRLARPRFGPPLGVSYRFIGAAARLSGLRSASSGEDAFDPQVAVSPTGAAVISWEVDQQAGCLVRAAYLAAPGAKPVTRTVSSVDAACPAGQRVAIDGAGNAVVTWLAQRGSTSSIQVSEVHHGRWQRQHSLSRGPDLGPPRIAENLHGDAAIVWSAVAGSDQVIDGAFRSRGGRWQAERVPKATGADASVGLDQHGRALIVFDDAAVVRSVSGRYSPPAMTLLRGSLRSPEVAVAPGGEVVETSDPRGRLLALATTLGVLSTG